VDNLVIEKYINLEVNEWIYSNKFDSLDE